ncbi:MAG TPA: nitroreductase family protein, partial [Gaiellaceae bacterium]
MDTFLAIASKRDERRYADRPVADEHVLRILDAGRLSGSSRNTQAWQFVVVSDRSLADAVYAPDNVRTAGLVIAIVGEAGMFDVGRCAQNMMLAAWDIGIVSCP